MLQKVYVGNLPLTATERDIRKMFAKFGPLHSVRIITDRETGQSRGYCFVELDKKEAAAAAKALHGSFFGTRHLFVRPARERLQSAGSGHPKSTW